MMSCVQIENIEGWSFGTDISESSPCGRIYMVPNMHTFKKLHMYTTTEKQKKKISFDGKPSIIELFLFLMLLI